MRNDLTRFAEAHGRDYPTALAEIRRGRKESHWMLVYFSPATGPGAQFICRTLWDPGSGGSEGLLKTNTSART